jgi:hypothetical protein
MMRMCFGASGEDMAGKVGLPLVIDLGQIESGEIGQLVIGTGKVLDDIDMAMGLVCQHIDSNGGDRVLLPVVVVYTLKKDARRTHDRLVVKVRARKK